MAGPRLQLCGGYYWKLSPPPILFSSKFLRCFDLICLKSCTKSRRLVGSFVGQSSHPHKLRSSFPIPLQSVLLSYYIALLPQTPSSQLQPHFSPLSTHISIIDLSPNVSNFDFNYLLSSYSFSIVFRLVLRFVFPFCHLFFSFPFSLPSILELFAL